MKNIIENLTSVLIWTVVLFFTAPVLFVVTISVFIGLVISDFLTGGLKQTHLLLKQTSKFTLPVIIGFIVGYGFGEFLVVGFGFSLIKIYFSGCLVGSLYFNFYNKKSW